MNSARDLKTSQASPFEIPRCARNDRGGSASVGEGTTLVTTAVRTSGFKECRSALTPVPGSWRSAASCRLPVLEEPVGDLAAGRQPDTGVGPDVGKRAVEGVDAMRDPDQVGV